MKVIVFVEYDYDWTCLSTEGVIVPDDYDEQSEMEKWREETFAPSKWKNQHGVTKTRPNPTIPFAKWLREKYEAVTVEECGW